MNTATEKILSFWKDPRNIPFKGHLISSEPPAEGQPPTTCMCAQGQVLHIAAGLSEEDLLQMEQIDADKEVAELLGISVSHSVLLRVINDTTEGAPSDVLTNPEKYLGPNYETVLDFWKRLDNLQEEDWENIEREFNHIDILLVGKVSANVSNKVNRLREKAPSILPQSVNTSMTPSQNSTGYVGLSCIHHATGELKGMVTNPVFVPIFEKFIGPLQNCATPPS